MDRPIIRYHGGKFRLAAWIISYLTQINHDVYIEPYAGAASILLSKPRSPIEVYNDLDGRLVNFFRVLRNNADELIAMIELTPYAIAEWQEAQAPAEDPTEDARRFYLRAQASIGNVSAQWSTGFRRQKTLSRGRRGSGPMKSAAITWSASLDHLYDIADRLQGVFIENEPALDIMHRYAGSPGALAYLDPPYIHETRSKWATAAYQHEMTDEDHMELLKVCRTWPGDILLSGYRSTLYDNWLRDWQLLEEETLNHAAASATEALYIKPATWNKIQNQQPRLL